MNLFRLLIFAVAASVSLACGSVPPPAKAPQNIHESVRHLNKGARYYIQGCYPKAMQHVQEAHERFSVADDLQGTADSLNTMANIYYRLGEFEHALAIYDETIELFERLKDKTGQVRALANKSATLIAARRLDDASYVLDHADDLSKDTDILTGLRLKTRAMLLMAQNKPGEAERLLVDALHAVPDSDHALRADIQYTFGNLMVNTQRPQQAVTHIQYALKFDRAAGAYFSIGLDLATLGSCYENMAQYAEAVNYYKRSLKIFALLEAPQKVAWVLPRLETSAREAGLNPQTTMRWAEQWLAGQREAGLCR